MRRRTTYGILGAVLVVCLLPLLGALLATGLAATYGCQVSEAHPSPCVIAGADRGGLLYTLYVSVWFALTTVPIAAIAAAALLWMGIGDCLRRRRGR